ncbi:MAG: ATP-binding protein, partial [Dehalococcoidia bacterium]
LWVERRTAPFRVRRSRATALLIAFGIGGLAATDFLPAYGVPLYAFGYVPIFGFIAIAAWAIWRYRLVDITPALAAERILTAMSDALIVVDRDGRIQVCNQAARDILGNGGVRLEGTLATAVLPGLPFLATPQALEAHGEVQHHEWTFRTVREEHRVLRISATPMYDAAGDPLAAICLATDITGLKATEQALHDANLRLEDAIQQLKDAQEDVLHRERLRALGRMASGVAHDFNNALMPILGYAELLHGDPALLKDETRARSYLEQIIKAAENARNNIARMRHLYRPRDEATQPLDLNDLVEQTLAATRPLWQGQTWASGGTATIETDLAPVPLVLGGEAELGEAITNLIINAVDAMPSGGTIHVRTSVEEGVAVLAISDTGAGMSAEVLERCQEPFFSTKGARGTGLGLAMVAQTVERHEGKMEITSVEGQGTTVTMRFPAHQGASQGQGMPVVSGAGPLPAMRVLLVDDEPAPREVLYQYLTRDGHAVEACSGGAEALAKFQEQSFDLVVSDLAMPGMSGLQLASAIKNTRPSVPVLLVTGFGTASLNDGGSRDGGAENVDMVLAKPITRDDLRRALNSLVKRAPVAC